MMCFPLLPADGGLYLSTPIDVLYVLLPVLERSRKKHPSDTSSAGVFCSMEQLLYDEQHPELARLAPLAEKHLTCVCDVKEVCDEKYYRLNDDLVRVGWCLLDVSQGTVNCLQTSSLLWLLLLLVVQTCALCKPACVGHAVAPFVPDSHGTAGALHQTIFQKGWHPHISCCLAAPVEQ